MYSYGRMPPKYLFDNGLIAEDTPNIISSVQNRDFAKESLVKTLINWEWGF